MPTAPDPTSIAFEALADGLSLDRLHSESDPTRDLQEYERMKRVEAVVAAHRRVLEQSPSSVDLDLDLLGGEGDPGPAPIVPPAPGSMEGLKRWGHLEILEVVGGGGFGHVYRARDPMLEREVALKIIVSRSAPPDEVKRRFLAEARRLARVRHDHVVTVHGAGIHDGRMGLWTDFLRGATLEEVLRHQGPFGAREAALIGIDLCRALAAVHAAGLIHRDVKTANVIREEGGRIVLVDFGLVAADPEASGGRDLESTGGTPLYMAPEVLKGRPATVPSDLYSLGVLLYRLVSGKYPLEALTLSAILEAHEQGRRTPLRTAAPDTPTAFVRVVEKALSLDPAERYTSAGAMELDLAAFVSPGAPKAPLARRRSTWIAAALALVLVLAAAWGLPRLASRDLDLEAALYRDRSGQPEQILSGSEVLRGDQLTLRLRLNRPGRAWVLNRDPSGAVQRVFPLESTEAPPLDSGIEHVLPGGAGDEEYGWTISTRAGMESFLLVVLGEPNPRIAQAIETLPTASVRTPAGPGDLAFLSEGTPDSSGKAVVSPRKATAVSEGALDAVARLVEEERARGADVRIERYDLRVAGMKEQPRR